MKMTHTTYDSTGNMGERHHHASQERFHQKAHQPVYFTFASVS